MLLAVPILTGLLALVGVPSVLADCTQLSPWPSFSRYAPSAERILIGTVVWTPGGEVNGRFTLRVDEVLRGSAPATIEFDNFRSGAPQPICPEDSYLRVHEVGERLAFADGASLPGVDHPVALVAYVKPSRPNTGLLPKMERLSEAEVRAIALLPPTDTVEITDTQGATDPALLVMLGAALFGALASVRRQAARRGSEPARAGVHTLNVSVASSVSPRSGACASWPMPRSPGARSSTVIPGHISLRAQLAIPESAEATLEGGLNDGEAPTAQAAPRDEVAGWLGWHARRRDTLEHSPSADPGCRREGGEGSGTPDGWG